MHVEILSMDFEDSRKSRLDKGGEKWMSLINCASIHQGHEWFSDDSRGRQEIFMCLAALFYRFANGGAKMSIMS